MNWNRAGRPSLLTEGLTPKVKLILHNLPRAGCFCFKKSSNFRWKWCSAIEVSGEDEEKTVEA